MGTTSLSYSIVGEAYLAFGMLGLFVYAIVYAIFLLSFDGILYHIKKKEALPLGILGIGVFLAFWGFRSFFALVAFLYPLILFIFLLRLIKSRSHA